MVTPLTQREPVIRRGKEALACKRKRTSIENGLIQVSDGIGKSTTVRKRTIAFRRATQGRLSQRLHTA